MATKSLVIVESPAKCKKIEKFLGAGYRVEASYGHLTSLPDLKHIDFENNFKPEFVPIESKMRQISALRKAISTADRVIIATDDDREGEAIGWHICALFKLPVADTERIIFHEITETAIKRAIQTPTRLNMDVIYAQQARQILDLIVGFKISPILWKNIVFNAKNSLSAGRCQTPALRLVYDNYREINDNCEAGMKFVYKTRGIFTNKSIEFTLNHDFTDKSTMEEFLEDSVSHAHIMTRMTEKTVSRNPPEPLITSTIQQTANNIMHISPKDTMTICQRLYETGYITYMRTDCKVYSMEFLDTVKPYIARNYDSVISGGDPKYSTYIHPDIERLTKSEKNEPSNAKTKAKESKESKDKKGAKALKDGKDKDKDKDKDKEQNLAQEAHEAIRPTKIEISELPEDEEFSARERKLYKIIWTTTLESCMADAVYITMPIHISAPSISESSSNILEDGSKRDKSKKAILYSYTSEYCIFKGWKIVKNEDDAMTRYFEYLKQLTGEKDAGITVKYRKISSKQSIRDTKQHYTESKLVQLLDQRGIGRPSTFSAIIEKIMERNYVKRGNVEGKTVKTSDYELEDDEITEIEGERTFGNEKNKLVIQPIGIVVCEFLIQNFPQLFDYDYTKKMESDLDIIAKGEMLYYELCGSCNSLIDDTIQSKSLDKSSAKVNIRIDDCHSYIIGKNGPVIRYCDPQPQQGDKTRHSTNNNVRFISISKDIEIDMDRLREGGYTLADIAVQDDDSGASSSRKPASTIELGVYKGDIVYLKHGQYGDYIEHKKTRKSMSCLDKKREDITIKDAQDVLEGKVGGIGASDKSTIVREINQELSIRKGKYGDYIFYKTAKMNRPQFLKLKGFPDNEYKKCDICVLKRWITSTYNIVIA